MLKYKIAEFIDFIAVLGISEAIDNHRCSKGATYKRFMKFLCISLVVSHKFLYRKTQNMHLGISAL